jgi:hypothetical protein
MSRPLSPLVKIILAAVATLGLNGAVIIALVLLGLLGIQLNQGLTMLFFFAAGIGLVQFIYILPICVYLRRRREWDLMKGVIIGACISLLLNGGCWLFLGGGFPTR